MSNEAPVERCVGWGGSVEHRPERLFIYCTNPKTGERVYRVIPMNDVQKDYKLYLNRDWDHLVGRVTHISSQSARSAMDGDLSSSK